MAELVMEPVVKSRHVLAAGYDHETRSLHVRFTNGSEYVYADVNLTEWHQLMAGNHGTFGTYLNAVIIPRHTAVKL